MNRNEVMVGEITVKDLRTDLVNVKWLRNEEIAVILSGWNEMR